MCNMTQATSPQLSDSSATTWELSSAEDVGSPCEGFTFSVEEQREQRRQEKELDWAVRVSEQQNELVWDGKAEKQVLKMLLSEAHRQELSKLPCDPSSCKRKYASLLSSTTCRSQLLSCYTFLPPPSPSGIYVDCFTQTLRRQAMLSKLRSSGNLFLEE